jgi:hypothetical protein
MIRLIGKGSTTLKRTDGTVYTYTQDDITNPKAYGYKALHEEAEQKLVERVSIKADLKEVGSGIYKDPAKLEQLLESTNERKLRKSWERLEKDKTDSILKFRERAFAMAENAINEWRKAKNAANISEAQKWEQEKDKWKELVNKIDYASST